MRLNNVEIKVIYLLQKMEFYQNHMDSAFLINKTEYDRIKHFYERTNDEYLELIKDWPERRINQIKNLIK
jgi:thymidylate kinase